MKVSVRNFDLNLLVVFLALHETRSVTKASERLSLSQSAVSHALRRLREALGDRLFIQGQGGLVPTARAGQLLGPARLAVQGIEAALSGEQAFDARTSTREFDIAASELIELALIPSVLGFLRRQAPGVSARLNPMDDEDSLIKQLENGVPQLVISSKTIKGAALRSEAIGEIPVSVLCSPRLAGNSMTVPERVYLQTPHVVLRHREPRRNVIDEAFADHKADRRVGAVVQNFFTMAMVAAQCDYIAHMPTPLALRFADMLGLAVRSSPLRMAASPVILTSHRSADSDAGVSWLKACVRSAAAEQLKAANENGAGGLRRAA